MFEALEKAPILDGIKAFNFKTAKGEKRRFEKVPGGWLQTWNGEVEDMELAVKLVFNLAKRDGSLEVEKES
jgi:hypothetical protein